VLLITQDLLHLSVNNDIVIIKKGLNIMSKKQTPYTKQLIEQFKTKYGLAGSDFWPLKLGGKEQWIINHNALERVAVQENISWSIEVLNFAPDVVVKATATHPNTKVTIESLGEAGPKTTKNAYLYAMAEKRAVDRCVLKLLNAHAYLYTDQDADEFKQKDEEETWKEQVK
jgi:hypothetical protein